MSTTTPQTLLTVRELADRWRVKQQSILAWIRSGELRALNLAATPSGRPRWKVPLDSVLTFESGRANRQGPKPARRKRKAADDGFVRYFGGEGCSDSL